MHTLIDKPGAIDVDNKRRRLRGKLFRTTGSGPAQYKHELIENPAGLVGTNQDGVVRG